MFWTHPDTLDWQYDEVQFKASHNSYARSAPLLGQLVFDATHPHWNGCRGLELDLRQSPSDRQIWSVDHDRFNRNSLLSTYLRRLVEWSDRQEDHDVITVMLDLKRVYSAQSDFRDVLDEFLTNHFGRDRLLVPADVVGADGAAVWPTLRHLRGRFIFVLSGSEKYKEAYVEDGNERLCFADYHVSPPIGSGPIGLPDDDRLFLNILMGDWRFGDRLRRLKELGDLDGFVVRAYYVNSDSWEDARDSAVNILATNELEHPRTALNRLAPFRLLIT